MSTFIASVKHLAIVSLLFAAGTSSAAQSAEPQVPAQPKPFALVELYTSEGCSSCPPADQVASALAKKKTPGVYVVAFHVDYWDYLGWKDVFSSPESSDRQREYARATQSESLYTPQMIVNGTREFVGSSRSKADNAIAAALTRQPTLSLTASATRTADIVTITTQLKDAPRETTIVAAVVQDGLVTDVQRGENAGRKLHHDRVVRSFTSKPWDPVNETALTLTLPADAPSEGLEVIIWAERADTREVLAVTATQPVAVANADKQTAEIPPKTPTPPTSDAPAKP